MSIETMKLALVALEEAKLHIWLGDEKGVAANVRCHQTITALRQAIEQAQQAEPVAMKFKIYKPTVPDPTRQGINNALLPWVYDQDRSSGFDASMWVTPVATLPPPRQPLTDEECDAIYNELDAWANDVDSYDFGLPHIAGGGIVAGREVIRRAIEAAHGIKGEV